MDKTDAILAFEAAVVDESTAENTRRCTARCMRWMRAVGTHRRS